VAFCDPYLDQNKIKNNEKRQKVIEFLGILKKGKVLTLS
jgi:uncharacterized protein (DUF2249 family)